MTAEREDLPVETLVNPHVSEDTLILGDRYAFSAAYRRWRLDEMMLNEIFPRESPLQRLVKITGV